ncbi:DUF3761 domain-containing protein [Paraburkholderia antibiotica]|uniref:DUF3761 domain-containing protein n=1 Tax=Paraburkholderia antibiotica TaxID=2728839 RepID=A0A7X9ZWV2_9BURK|nr:DUF3761 domain-containing protein [Paraburkholderia antibiotica]NML31342.1 DUF3761 domain-containing protein [Paraburkholderia antibiotica]
MKKSAIPAVLVAGLFASLSSFAQVPASAPAGTTALCKDGSFSSSAIKKTACKGHKGVKTWFGATVSGAATASPSSAAIVTGASTTAAAVAPTVTASTTPVASGGGSGQVWVNTKTKVYHCSGDPVYGKTKQGQYMSEAAAKTAGDHAAHGKTCS